MRPQLKDFQGSWNLQKTINDLAADQIWQFAGQAAFIPQDEGLLYQESGQLHRDDMPALTATRSYLWRSSGPRIVVSFEDGRSFHSFDPRTPPGEHTGDIHICPPDRYEVLYDFENWPIWSSTWVVRGPKKSYVMRSHYTQTRD